MKNQFKDIWNHSVEEMVIELSTDTDKGLSASEAESRLKLMGKNSISEDTYSSDLMLLINQFKSPFMILLLLADGLSFFLGQRIDAMIILGLILLSAFLSFWQERGAQNIVKSLLNAVKVTAAVCREGKITHINLENVVPGDIVELSAGDIVPADGLVVDCHNLFVDEAMLTGEPFPVEKRSGVLPPETVLKDRHNTLYRGTHVMSGYTKMLVVVTGKNTEFGQIAEKIKFKEETEFERGLRRFGHLLIEISFILALIIFAVNIFFQKPFIDSLLFSLTLAIGVTPFLLPAIVSINLAYGAKHMARNKVIVKRLVSIENFGSMNVFCSDKTGTLTSGEIQVQDFLAADGLKNDRIMDLAFLNASLQTGYSNPVDTAIKDSHSFDMSGIEKLDEIPFDFNRKRLSVLIKEKGNLLLITKGTYKKVIEVCDFVEVKEKTEPLTQHRKNLENLFGEATAKGLRIIAVAYRKMDQERINRDSEAHMVLAGILFLNDPMKEGVLSSVLQMKKMGIQLKILTGDNVKVAQYVGKQLDIDEKKALTGNDLTRFHDNALLKKVNSVHIFAELEPSQKERIVRLLSRAGNVVGYIGDGINDVPALQAADVGISVDNSVDIAKNTADFILLEKNLNVLLNGILEGRRTFVNTIKYIFMTSSANFGNIISMAIISLFLPFLPLLPKQILATNFLSDLPAMTIPGDNIDKDWETLPKKWNLHFIKKFMIHFGLLSSVFDFLTFGLLLFVIKSDVSHFRSGWFMVTILTEFVVLWVLRTKEVFYKSKPGKLLLYSTLFMFLLGMALPYTVLGSILELSKLPFTTMALLIGIVVLYAIANEVLKRFFYRRNHF